MIVIASTDFARAVEGEAVRIRLAKTDESTFNGVFVPEFCRFVAGSLLPASGSNAPETSKGHPEDTVRVIVSATEGTRAAGFALHAGKWQEHDVDIVRVNDDLFVRYEGLVETSALIGKYVAVCGLGSFGGPIARGLSQSGVFNLALLDDERLEVCNVQRQEGTLRDVGRYKTRYLADLVRERNPSAHVDTHELRITRETEDTVTQIVRKSDVVICALDDRQARLILNRICVANDTPLIMAGAFPRAYGGQVLRVRARQSPCYQCFLTSLELSGSRSVQDVQAAPSPAYSDRPASIEPGLALDILPMPLMTVKLALQELLCDAPATTLRNLDEDLSAHWYVWLNRRDPGSQYEHLEPLAYHRDGMHIMRWYGIQYGRVPGCPVCGQPEDEAKGVSEALEKSAASAIDMMERIGDVQIS